jgi:hypothetical protein
MKLAEALSISPITLTMQLYAQPYGLELTTQMRDKIKNLQANNATFFVFVGKLGLDVLETRERNVRIAQIVGGRVRDGVALYFLRGEMNVIDFSSWKASWSRIISGQVGAEMREKAAQDREDRRENRERRKLLSEMGRQNRFKEAAEVTTYKKMGKRGYNMTFDELRRKRQIEEFDAQFKRTEIRARQIASVL